jgi:Zn-dependent M28 family amino/carboxypeptidase
MAPVAGVVYGMMIRRFVFTIAGVAAAALPVRAQRTATALPTIDSAAAWQTLSALAADSMEGRRIGSRGSARARALLEQRLRRAGVRPFGLDYEHRFPVSGRDTSIHTGVNVLAFVPGADTSRIIVVSAHYDHVGIRNGEIYNGADDNASGTAAVLAIAEWYGQHPPQHSMLFAFFDGEEAGLLGALAFVPPRGKASQFAVDVNLDMVARLDKNELYAAGATPWPFFRPLLEATAKVAPVKLLLGHDTDEKGAHENWTGQSDQGAFHRAGIPWVYFGVEDHADYHRPSDDVEKINAARFIGAVRTIADFIRRLDQALDTVIAARS